MKFLSIISMVFCSAFGEVNTEKYPQKKLTVNSNSTQLYLLDSHLHPCHNGANPVSCEMNLIYEKNTQSIIQLLSGSRIHKDKSMDINEVLENPSYFNGDLKVIRLNSLFPDTSVYDSVIARFTKNREIYIEIQSQGRIKKTTISIP